MTRSDLHLILTHEHTDFDALASLLGASLLYPEATPVLPRKLNRNVREFATLYHAYLPFVQPGDLPKGRIGKVILVDTRALSAPRAISENCEVLVIDHHSAPEDEEGQPIPPERPRGQRTTPASWTIIHEPVGANATMLIERIVEARIQLSPLHATLLALGIHEDTGSLTYGGTTQRDAAALAWLLDPEHSINLDVVSRFLNHPLSEEQRALFQQLIANSEFYDDAGLKVVVAVARTENMSEEISTVAARLRDFHEPDALFLLVAMKEMVQIVARSTTDDIDVGAIMQGMGGGGHVRAAAAPVRGIAVEEIRARILAGVNEQARSAVTVATIMSQGRPQTLAPDMTIAEAANLMRRYGHEGFPVVEVRDAQTGADTTSAHNGDSAGVTILGVLTRREADRAMDHGMGNATVARFMRAGAVTVTPEDSLASLRRAMSESGWGQVPVVSKTGDLLGIVTRTDLIKTWDDQNPSAMRRNEVEQRLAQRLTPVQHALTQLVGKTADGMRYTLYVVGGFVRDLFIRPDGTRATEASTHTPVPAEFDIDIVIEGDAIALAQRMRDLYGGRVVPHRQFGTAKWLLHDEPTVNTAKLMADLGVEGALADLPAHLDFVTARTEFYTAPTVLPTVESSSIKLDLLRRDFTINTLAVCLNPSRWGELLDFFGGLRDIQQGIIRVLHSLSFVDDPTRILRAVRYEQRFNFRIGTRTLEHMDDALELLEKVSPARVRHEIERTLQEEAPERILLRMDTLLILQSLHPQLRADAWTARQFAALRATRTHADSHLHSEPLERLYWATLVFRMEANTDEELTARLRLRRETQMLVRGVHKLRGRSDQIAQPNQPPSAIVALLEGHEPAEIALFALLCEDEQIRAYAEQYFAQWRQVHQELDGNDLQALGLPRGPIYREVLWALRAARLDGEITTRAEEIAYARQYAHDAQTG